VGVVLRDFREIGPVVSELLATGALDSYRGNAAAISNQALFEIPEILDKILRSSGG
jgi:hypothetical protein